MQRYTDDIEDFLTGFGDVMTLSYCTYSAPWGELLLCADDQALVACLDASDEALQVPACESFVHGALEVSGCHLAESPVLTQAVAELDEYFAGSRTQFEVPLDFSGYARSCSAASTPTAFMLEVWRALLDIPYGETYTYAELAQTIGRPRAARAVGNALNKNPLMIFAPCHRVVGVSNPWGFACGADVKRALLAVEGAL